MAEVLKYSLLKQDILKKINSGEYAVGKLIPSEREFIEGFHVSRTTVRKALEDLEQEGLLYRVQGKGTFVKSQKGEYDLFSLTSCTEDIQRHGGAVRRRVLAQEVVPASMEMAGYLKIETGAPILALDRIYYADNIPLNITKTHLPLSLFPGLDRFRFAEESLYRVLQEEYGVEIIHARRSIRAVLSDTMSSAHLEVELGTPLLLFECTTQGKLPEAGKQMIEHFYCRYRTDHYRFFIDQVRGR